MKKLKFFATLFFRLINKLIGYYGFVLSKPEVIHGSPAFMGSALLSRKILQFKTYYNAVHDIDGDVVEAGIHWGYGLVAHLHNDNANRKIFAFDSFEGHSSAHENDKKSSNWFNLSSLFKVSIEDVHKTLNFSGFPLEVYKDKIVFIAGWAQSTMPQFNQSNKISLVHCDMDIYEPVLITLKSFWPLLQIGGIIVVGRLNNPELMGKTNAFNEFVNSLNLEEYKIDVIKTREINTFKLLDETFIQKIK